MVARADALGVMMRSHVVLITALAAMLTSAPTASAQAFVTADSITPSSGSGLDQTFVLHYSDSTGAADLGAWVWFHDATAVNTAPSCLLAYTCSGARRRTASVPLTICFRSLKTTSIANASGG